MSRSFNLYRLQQIDSQYDQVSNRLKEIEAALSQDEALRLAQELVDVTLQQLEQRRKALQHEEVNVQAQQIKIEQTEATLYGGKVHNPKELQDMQNEAAALKRYLNVLEDRQLEAMLSLEDAEAAHNAAAVGLQEAQARSAEKNSGLHWEQEKLLDEAARLEDDRAAAAETPDDGDLELYEKLRQQRRGVAVAKVVERCCGACGSTLNAALLQNTRSPSQITRCDTCGRILYGG